MSVALDVSSPRRVEARDARADGFKRLVVVSREGVLIKRAVAGVAMSIRLAPHDFRGLVLRLARFAEDDFHYQLSLAHRDPDLTVILAESTERAEIEREWRAWAGVLKLRAFVERSPGREEAADIASGPLGARAPIARRRGKATTRRRPRFLVRRKVGRPNATAPALADFAVLFHGAKAGR
jgi:hypothetical protein